jgi:maleate cis-trans isomerase
MLDLIYPLLRKSLSPQMSLCSVLVSHKKEIAMIRHFGVLIPSTNTTVEIEFTRLLPEPLQFHVARLGKGGNTPFSPSLDADVAYQSKMLGNSKVEVVCLIQTSASLFEEGYDARIKAMIAEGANVPATTSAEAIGMAANALGTKKIALVSPYSEEVISRAKTYYETLSGLEVVAMEGFGATDAYAIGALDESHALAAFEQIDSPEIEALVVPGGNFPTMRHIAGWEERFGKPVITTNQVVLWSVMKSMGVQKPIEGLGRLLFELP